MGHAHDAPRSRVAAALALALASPWVEGAGYRAGRLPSPRWRSSPIPRRSLPCSPSSVWRRALALSRDPSGGRSGRRPRRSRSRSLLTAFWSLPFAVRRAWVVPLAWAISPRAPGDLWARPVLLGLAVTGPSRGWRSG